MKSKIAIVVCLALVCVFAARGRDEAPRKTPLVARVGDTGFLEVRADSFSSLTPRQQALAYWLTRASIAIDPIIYDQLSAYGLREKRLLEEIVAHPQGIDPRAMKSITEFTQLFWANRGNHDDDTGQKFLPDFTFEQLKQAALTAQEHGAMKSAYASLSPITTRAQLEKELNDLRPALFDASFQPMDTAKTPLPGLDIVQSSSNTFYPGLSLQDLKGFHELYPLDSRVVRGPDGRLREEVYRAGTPNGKIPAGLYAVFLKKANGFLAKAQALADPQEAKVIGDLIRYYQTGSPQDWLQFDSDWVRDDATVDFANGFIEVYRDALGRKGSSQSFVSITDRPETQKMMALANNAAYFEQKAPWPAQYKRTAFTKPVVKAVETVIETGDFHVTTIGDNLPNENIIHQKYGSKNFLLVTTTHAFDHVSGGAVLREFASSPEEIARDEKYGDEAEDLMTALHEVIGHGSGKLSPRLKDGAQPYLKQYYSTLEEGRADLMALWNIWDPKLKQLGLIGNQEEVAKAMYDQAARQALTQLDGVPHGDTLEEDHARDRQMIVRYIMATTGGIEQFDRDGKTYVQVTDYQKMREGVGQLLGKLMVIKATGDYEAIQNLVNKYGSHFDPKLRDQVVARYKRLGLPNSWAGINAQLTARFGADGKVERVKISYPADPVAQYMGYAAMYDKGLRGGVVAR